MSRLSKRLAMMLYGVVCVASAHADIADMQAQAGAGDVSAYNSLGDAYYYGRDGAQKNLAKAVANYRKAADAGNAQGQYNLGYCYAHGFGVAMDSATGLKWLLKASDQGSVNARNEIGANARDGNGVAKDPAVAAKWFRSAADGGSAGGQANLGALYLNGIGVERDLDQARIWLQKAAAQGNAKAKADLALLGPAAVPAANIATTGAAPSTESDLPPMSYPAALAMVGKYFWIDGDMDRDTDTSSLKPNYKYQLGDEYCDSVGRNDSVNSPDRFNACHRDYYSDALIWRVAAKQIVYIRQHVEARITDFQDVYYTEGGFSRSDLRRDFLGAPVRREDIDYMIRTSSHNLRVSVAPGGDYSVWSLKVECAGAGKCLRRVYSVKQTNFTYAGDTLGIEDNQGYVQKSDKTYSAVQVWMYQKIDDAKKAEVARALQTVLNY